MTRGVTARRLRTTVVAFLVGGLITTAGSVLAPSSIGGARPAGAVTSSCSSCTAPTNVNFYMPGSTDANGTGFNLGNYLICGLVAVDSGLGSQQVDLGLDDQAGLASQTNIPGPLLTNSDGSQTQTYHSGGNEGNYTNAEVFSFQPTTGTLSAGDRITLSLPHPVTATADQGSVLPPASVDLAATGEPWVNEETESTVSAAYASSTYSTSNPDPSHLYAVVTVQINGVPIPSGGLDVQLGAFDPLNPPPVGKGIGSTSPQSLLNEISISPDGQNSFTTSKNSAYTDASGKVVFDVYDNNPNNAESLVTFGATDITNTVHSGVGGATGGVGIVDTAELGFTDTPHDPGSQRPCGGAPNNPSTNTAIGYNYLLSDTTQGSTDVAVIAPSVAVTTASGHEKATITVPQGFTASPTDTVELVVLNAKAPPACCTTSQIQSYQPPNFSLWTTNDPVPGHPSSTEAAEYVWANEPMDPAYSSLTPTSSTVNAGSASTLTATMHDAYDNPITGDDVAIYQAAAGESGAGFTAISCVPGASPPSCIAVDDGGRALAYTGNNYNAGTWTPTTIDRSGGGLTAVSCPTVSFCEAVDADGDALSYNGEQWTTPTQIDPRGGLTAVSCPSATFCLATDHSGYLLTDSNGSWTTASLRDAYPITAVSCASASACMAVDSQGDALRYSAGAWRGPSRVLTAAGAGFTAVSCATATLCVAAATDGTAAFFNGSTWTGTEGNVAGDELTGASCLTVSTGPYCALVDQAGNVWTSSSGATWSYYGAVDPTGGGITGVSCYAANACVAVDALGQALAPFLVPADPLPIDTQAYENGASFARNTNSVSCVNDTFCATVDQTSSTAGALYIYAGPKNGDPWQRVETATDTALEFVSCPAAGVCIAIGPTSSSSSDKVYTYNQASGSWTSTSLTLSSSGATIVSLSCASTTTCMAVDSSGYAYRFTGGAWRTPVAVTLGGFNGFVSVSCPFGGTCYALTYAGSVWVFTNGNWSDEETLPAAPSGSILYTALSCSGFSTSTVLCQFVQTGASEAVWQVGSGAVATAPLIANPAVDYITAASCASTTQCTVVDVAGNTYSFDGTSWSEVANPGLKTPTYNSISCSQFGLCMAVSTSGLAEGLTTNWAPQSVDPINSLLADVTPDNASQGSAYPTTATDGTASYDVTNTCAETDLFTAVDLGPPSGGVAADEVPQPSSVSFVAGPASAPDAASTPSQCGVPPVRSSVTASAGTDGVPWSQVPAGIPSGENLTAVSCPSPSFCVAVDNATNFLTYDGSTWSAPTPVAPPPAAPALPPVLTAVSCPSTSFCMAVGNGVAYTYSSGSWTAVPTATDLVSVSCPSSTVCWTVDYSANAYSYDSVSNSWTPYTLTGSPAPALDSISCPDADGCTAVSDGGNAWVLANGTWSEQSVGSGSPLQAVSCSSEAFCVATDFAGKAYVDTAGSWSAAEPVSPPGNDAIPACVGPQFCVAISSGGTAASFDGTSWSIDQLPASAASHAPAGVSCASSTYCVTVGGPNIFASGAPVAPADGTRATTVSVTLADQYGNPDACHQVVLEPAATGSTASIIPLAPTSPCPSSATNGPGFTGVDGVARFAVSDTNTENVSLGVTDVTKVSSWPNNPTSNPLDSAQVDFLGVSNVAISPSSDHNAPASGLATASLQVVLTDSAGQPVSGKAVSLVDSSSSTVTIKPQGQTGIVPAGDAETDATGTAAFLVGDSVQEVASLTATDASDGDPSLSATGSINFTYGGAGLASDGHPVVADGTGQESLSYVIADLTDAGLSNLPIEFSVPDSESAGVNFSCTAAALNCTSDGGGAQSWTDAGGATSMTVSDTTAGPLTVTATALNYPNDLDPNNCPEPFKWNTVQHLCEVSVTVVVDFIQPPARFDVSPQPPGPCSTEPFCAVPSSTLGDGLETQTITVTARDASHNLLAGLPIPSPSIHCVTSLATAIPCASSDVISVSPSRAVTNASGQVTFTLTALISEASPVFVGLTPSYSSDQTYSDLLLPPSGCPTTADCYTILTFNPTEASSSALCTPPVSASTPLEPPNCAGETATAPADGSSTVELQAQLFDGSKPLQGHIVTLDTGSAATTVTPVSCPESPGFTPGETDTNGQACFTVSDAGLACTASSPSCPAAVLNVSALDLTTGTTVRQSTQITFTPPEVLMSTVNVDGRQAITAPIGPSASPNLLDLDVTLLDTTGSPIEGHAVSIATGSSTATVRPIACADGNDQSNPAGTSDNFGNACFSVSDSAPETIGIVATDSQDPANPVTLDSSPTIVFQPDVSSESIVRASPVTSPAGGPAVIVTVDLRQGNYQPLPGATVTFENPGAFASITPVDTDVSDANGQAKFLLADPHIERLQIVAAESVGSGRPVPLDQTANVSFVASEANQSSAKASPTKLAVNSKSTVTVVLRTSSDKPIANHSVKLSGCGTTLVCQTLTSHGVTTATGEIQFSVTSTSARKVSISVTDSTAKVTLVQKPTITFTAG